jgi:hypothetical protein
MPRPCFLKNDASPPRPCRGHVSPRPRKAGTRRLISAKTTVGNVEPDAGRALRAREATEKVGSPGWSRTSDFLINSQALYQLSYRGVASGASDTSL